MRKNNNAIKRVDRLLTKKALLPIARRTLPDGDLQILYQTYDLAVATRTALIHARISAAQYEKQVTVHLMYVEEKRSLRRKSEVFFLSGSETENGVLQPA